LAQRASDEFEPDNRGDWFSERVQDWSKDSPDGRAYLHSSARRASDTPAAART